MSKNKKTQIINNIESINLEIDYDRLAQAIVKANENADKGKKYVSGTFAFLSSILFCILSGIGFLFAFVGIIGSVVFFIQNLSAGFFPIIKNIMISLLIIISSVLIGLFAYIFLKAGKEISNEKDRNFIISAFSGIVSFVALIVALIALAKGIQ